MREKEGEQENGEMSRKEEEDDEEQQEGNEQEDVDEREGQQGEREREREKKKKKKCVLTVCGRDFNDGDDRFSIKHFTPEGIAPSFTPYLSLPAFSFSSGLICLSGSSLSLSLLCCSLTLPTASQLKQFLENVQASSAGPCFSLSLFAICLPCSCCTLAVISSDESLTPRRANGYAGGRLWRSEEDGRAKLEGRVRITSSCNRRARERERERECVCVCEGEVYPDWVE